MVSTLGRAFVYLYLSKAVLYLSCIYLSGRTRAPPKNSRAALRKTYRGRGHMTRRLVNELHTGCLLTRDPQSDVGESTPVDTR